MFVKIITSTMAALLFMNAGLAMSFETPEIENIETPAKGQLKPHSHCKNAHHKHHMGYIKPGAAIALSHDYDGQTALGEFETITLTLSHIYENGQLTIDILPTEGLEIFSGLSLESVPIETSVDISLPIQFSGLADGTYSIAIETIYESPEGQQSRRVQSVLITIGTKPVGKSQPPLTQIEKTKATGLIALPAEEIIR